MFHLSDKQRIYQISKDYEAVYDFIRNFQQKNINKSLSQSASAMSSALSSSQRDNKITLEQASFINNKMAEIYHNMGGLDQLRLFLVILINLIHHQP